MSVWLRVVWCGFGVVWIWCGLFARRWCLHGVLCKCGNRRNRILICTLASIWNIWNIRDWLRDRDRNPSGSKRLTKDLFRPGAGNQRNPPPRKLTKGQKGLRNANAYLQGIIKLSLGWTGKKEQKSRVDVTWESREGLWVGSKVLGSGRMCSRGRGQLQRTHFNSEAA